MNMVEKVARAMFDLSYKQGLHKDIEKDLMPRYRELAKATIQAMREPTKEMLSEGKYSCSIDGYGRLGMSKCWNRMIDAALKE